MMTGPNGSGKSTLLRCLATALKPHQGQVLFEGQDLWSNRRSLRHRIAYLGHQLHVWDDLSPRQNLQAWSRMTGRADRSAELLQRVSLDPTRSDPVRALSAGMKRRLALARMLLKSPSLALLDEPFGALDPEGRQLVLSVIEDLKADGATVLLATHLPDFAAPLCSHHLALESGRAVRAEAL